MTNEDDLSELRNEAESGTRFDSTDPGSEGDKESEPLVELLLEKLDEIEGGESPNVTIRDRNMAALLRALEEREELDDLGRLLDDESATEYNKAQIGRLLFRAGLEAKAPEYLETLEEAAIERIEI